MPRSNWAREPQLLSLRVWSLCSATGEAAIVRGPRTAMRSGPRLPRLEKALAQKQRPNTAKIKKKKKKKNLLYYVPILRQKKTQLLLLNDQKKNTIGVFLLEVPPPPRALSLSTSSWEKGTEHEEYRLLGARPGKSPLTRTLPRGTAARGRLGGVVCGASLKSREWILVSGGAVSTILCCV